MTHEQREEYIKQAKKHFSNHPDVNRNSDVYKAGNWNESQNESKGSLFGFWKVRFLIAVLLFVGIFSIKQTNNTDSFVTQEKIAAIIERDMDFQTVQAWFEQK